MDQNGFDAMFYEFLFLVNGKNKHWEEVEPGVWQVKECYSRDKNNRTKLTIKLEGEEYHG